MTSFQIGISPHKRVAGRFLETVRRTIQRALVEEHAKSGITQSDIARSLGIHRSVINREIRGMQDLTMSRVAQIAWALGRMPRLTFDESPQVKGNYFSTSDKTPVTRRRLDTGTANTNSRMFLVSRP